MVVSGGAGKEGVVWRCEWRDVWRVVRGVALLWALRCSERTLMRCSRRRRQMAPSSRSSRVGREIFFFSAACVAEG